MESWFKGNSKVKYKVGQSVKFKLNNNNDNDNYTFGTIKTVNDDGTYDIEYTEYINTTPSQNTANAIKAKYIRENAGDNNWIQFLIDIIQLFVLLLLYAIIGANAVYLSTAPMNAINKALPTNINAPPYKGEWIESEEFFSKIAKGESREELLEFLFPMKSVSFPYYYNSLSKNEIELMDMGGVHIKPLKWMGATTAWAYCTGRLLLKSFIVFLKWTLTYFKNNTFIFFFAPMAIMMGIHMNITTTLGIILMYVGGFMTDTGVEGIVFAIFAIVMFILAGAAVLRLFVQWIMDSRNKIRRITGTTVAESTKKGGIMDDSKYI